MKRKARKRKGWVWITDLNARKPEPRSVVYIVEVEGEDGRWLPISEWTTRRANAMEDKREWDEAAPGYKHRVSAYERRAKA